MHSRLNEVLYESRSLRKLMPAWLKEHIGRCSPTRFLDYLQLSFAKRDPYADDERFGQYKGKSRYTLGIVKEFTHSHRHYIATCRQMDVSYKVLDITASNWVEVIRNSQCDAFLIWPSPLMTIWKQMYDERLRVMVHDMGKIIFPSYDELWMWKSKRRMRDWLAAHNIPHPRTWIFYNLDEAKQFVEAAQFPVVFKPDFGDCARGVKIVRSKKEAQAILKKAFTRGIRLPGAHHLDLQWGNVVFQEYLPEVAEWRMVRIGESYFGFEKLRKGDFHSGSHAWRYARPPSQLLSFVRYVTDKGEFSSMSLDVFLTSEGQYLVNELQSLFGMLTPSEPQCVIDDKPGRMVYDPKTDSWKFEPGNFCENHLCNLRVKTTLRLLEEDARLRE